MEAVRLTGCQLFWFMMVGTLTIGGLYVVIIWILRKREGHLEAFLAHGNAVKMLTVVVVVFATTILAIMGMLTDAVSAIFGGIVGYVLGSMKGAEKCGNKDEKEGRSNGRG